MNTAVGGGNTGSNVTGNGNSNFGFLAGYNVTGSENTSLGMAAGGISQTNYAVSVGSYAGRYAQGNGNINIGSFAGSGTSATKVVADSGMSLGNGSEAQSTARNCSQQTRLSARLLLRQARFRTSASAAPARLPVTSTPMVQPATMPSPSVRMPPPPVTTPSRWASMRAPTTTKASPSAKTPSQVATRL